MIFLNLFLAILLENFDVEEEETPEKESSKDDKVLSVVKTVSLKIKDKCSMYSL